MPHLILVLVRPRADRIVACRQSIPETPTAQGIHDPSGRVGLPYGDWEFTSVEHRVRKGRGEGGRGAWTGAKSWRVPRRRWTNGDVTLVHDRGYKAYRSGSYSGTGSRLQNFGTAPRVARDAKSSRSSES